MENNTFISLDNLSEFKTLMDQDIDIKVNSVMPLITTNTKILDLAEGIYLVNPNVVLRMGYSDELFTNGGSKAILQILQESDCKRFSIYATGYQYTTRSSGSLSSISSCIFCGASYNGGFLSDVKVLDLGKSYPAKMGYESISGQWSFYYPPTITNTPTQDNEAVTKKYVDDLFDNVVNYVDSDVLVLAGKKKGLYILNNNQGASTHYIGLKLYEDSSEATYATRALPIVYVLKDIPEENINSTTLPGRFARIICVVDGITSYNYDMNGSSIRLTIEKIKDQIEILSGVTNANISAKFTYTTLPESSLTPTANNQFVNKKYVDDTVAAWSIQYATMPTASASTVGKIVQFTGTTDSTYTNGYFYVGTSETTEEGGETVTTYGWNNIKVQDDDIEAAVVKEIKAVDFDNPQFNLVGLKQGTYFLHNKVNDPKTSCKIKLDNNFNTYNTISITNGIIYIVTDVTDNTPDLTLLGTYVTQGLYGYLSRGLIFKNMSTTSGLVITSMQTTPEHPYITTNENQTISSKKTFSTLPESSVTPTTDNQLVNKKYVDNIVAAIETTKRLIVQTLPTTDIATDTIYMVPRSTPETENVYDEYLYINDAWEKIGSTEVDLTNYLAKDNSIAFTPTGDYNPATKKYVDDNNYITPLTISTETDITTLTKGVYLVNFATGGSLYYIHQPHGGGGGSSDTDKKINLTDVPDHCIINIIDNYANITDGDPFCYYLNSNLDVTILIAELTSLSRYTAVASNTLTKNNNTAYSPSGDYNPATKKYVDDTLNNIAPKYDNTTTYAVGDYVIYEGILYECNTDIQSAESWTAAHWTQTTLAELLGNIKSLLGGI